MSSAPSRPWVARWCKTQDGSPIRPKAKVPLAERRGSAFKLFHDPAQGKLSLN